MISLQSIARRQFLTPGTVSTSATSASLTLDRRGFNYGLISVVHGAATAATSAAKWSVLKLQEATASTGAWTDISGAVGTTNTTAAAGEFVLPSHADTANSQVIQFRIDLRNRLPFIRALVQAPAAQATVAGEALLGSFETVPTTASNTVSIGAGTVVTV